MVGPRPMIEGSSADHSLSRMRARGVRPCLSTAASEARITQAAPSVIWLELPGVTLPQGFSKAGLSLASFSTLLSGRTPSSWSWRVPSAVTIGATSPFSQPSSWARARRWWLSTA
jgi:hypothetical protein